MFPFTLLITSFSIVEVADLSLTSYRALSLNEMTKCRDTDDDSNTLIKEILCARLDG